MVSSAKAWNALCRCSLFTVQCCRARGSLEAGAWYKKSLPSPAEEYLWCLPQTGGIDIHIRIRSGAIRRDKASKHEVNDYHQSCHWSQDHKISRFSLCYGNFLSDRKLFFFVVLIPTRNSIHNFMPLMSFEHSRWIRSLSQGRFPFSISHSSSGKGL